MLKYRVFVSAEIVLAVVLAASAIACASESEPEVEKPAPASAPGTNQTQGTEDTKETTGSQDTKASRKGHLVIGNLIDMSGPLADFGEAHRKAAELAARHITEAGGTPVTIVHRDTGTDLTRGIEAARELIESEKVAAIVSSGRAPAMSPSPWRSR